MEAKFGQRIREVRKSFGLSQVQLAEKAGIGVATLQRYELNERQPKIETLQKIAEPTTCPFLFYYNA